MLNRINIHTHRFQKVYRKGFNFLFLLQRKTWQNVVEKDTSQNFVYTVLVTDFIIPEMA